MKLSEIKGERALDVLADILEPVVELAKDKELADLIVKDRPAAIRRTLKDHKTEVIAIMAAIDGEKPETYVDKFTVLTLPLRLLELFSDEELVSLFQSQGQNTDQTYFGSATENTEVTDQ